MIPPAAIARARGLQTRLLPRSALLALAEAPDLPEALAERGLVPSSATGPAEVERALRRLRTDRLAILSRWTGDALPVVFLDEDRRSLIELHRRVYAGRAGIDGLTPTPALPERALQTLAEQDLDGLAALLVAWRHPLAAGLLGAESLPAREQALHRNFFRRARRGDRALRRTVRLLVDIQNAQALRVAREQPELARDPEAWIPGGAQIDKRAYAEILEGKRPLELAGVADLSERGVLATLLERSRREARAEPLGSGPVLHFAHRLRAEATDLRTLVWGRALGTPAATLKNQLVTP